MNKFEDVDVIASLEAIMKQNTAFYQNDFDLDRNILQKAAASPTAEDRRLLWFSRPSGTSCFRERDVFLKGTRQHNTWRFYGEQTRDKVLAYAVELTGIVNGKIKGGSKEKIKFETYIQTNYFDRIIARANTRFMVMSGGQYELKRQTDTDDRKSQSGLELNVIDHYNGSERSVKTLSGGESFKASLSLALGLSDEIQASAGGIQLDTMFVDEGFGSLDEESLEQAMKALNGLTEGNRLVGIISHVQELKARIEKQIVVTKEKAGGSRVELKID